MKVYFFEIFDETHIVTDIKYNPVFVFSKKEAEKVREEIIEGYEPYRQEFTDEKIEIKEHTINTTSKNIFKELINYIWNVFDCTDLSSELICELINDILDICNH